MPTTTPSAALAPTAPVFTNTERLALAGFLAGYSGLTLHPGVSSFLVREPGQRSRRLTIVGATAHPPSRTVSPGPSCSAGWTSCRCRPSAPPPTWAA
jgi:hypothetical protein